MHWSRVFLISLLISVSSFALSTREFTKHFESSRIEFPDENSKYAQVSPGRYSGVLHFIYEHLLDWNPTGRRAEYSANCDPELWAERLRDPRIRSVQLQGALLQKYFKDCDSELKTGSGTSKLSPLKMMTMKLDLQNHPFLHRVVFHLPGDIHLKALLALKGDRKKRPLVVVRLGIFGGVEELLAERYLLLQLFEQSPFNVLIVENMSSPDFIANNMRFSFGGYDEGLQNIQIAKYLRDPNEPLSQLVHSLHFMGVSLGGHGVLYASMLNDLNQKPIQSFVGFCPVVNLKASMEHLSGGMLEQKAANYWSATRMQGLREKIPSLAGASSFEFMPKVREVIQRNYTGGLSYHSGIRLPAEIPDQTDFWKMNDFWWAYHNVSAPVLILATEKDYLVPFAMNSQNLKKKNIKVVSFDEGLHCSFPIPYQWDAFSSLLQAYVMSHSEGFYLREEKMQIDVTNENMKTSPGRVDFDISWPGKKDKFVRIEMADFQLSLPISLFDFQFSNANLVPSEKRMLERWLQHNLKIHLDIVNHKKILNVTWQKVI